MQEYNTDGVLTFSKIFKYLKKALPVLLITMMVAVIISVIITAVGKKDDKQYETQAVIELTYTGADAGLAPDGGLFDKANLISIDKIETILNNLNLSSKFSASDIRNAFVVTPRYSESIMAILEKTTNTDELLKLLEGIKPTSYSIKLYYTNVANLSKENSLDIVKGVISENTKAISETLRNQFTLPGGIADKTYLESYTHLEYVTVMSNYLSSYKSTVNTMDNTVDIQNTVVKLNFLENQNDILYNYIVTNGLLTDDDKTRSMLILEKQKKQISDRLTVVNENIKNLSDTISQIVPKTDNGTVASQSNSGNIIIPDYSSVLETLTNGLLNLYNDQSWLMVQFSALEERYSEIKNIAPVDSIDSDSLKKINEFKQELYEGINYVSDALKQRADGIATIHGIKTTLDPVNLVNNESAAMVKSMIINVVISLLVGFVLGLIIYAIIEKNVLKHRKQIATNNANTVAIVENVEIANQDIESDSDDTK